MNHVYLRVLEGFEDGDQVIRNVASADIAEALVKDGPAAALLDALRLVTDDNDSSKGCDHVCVLLTKEEYAQITAAIANATGYVATPSAPAADPIDEPVPPAVGWHRLDLIPYIGHVLDTALSAERKVSELHPGAVLVGWQCGFEPHVIAVIDAYDGMAVDEDEAIEIAKDWLQERKWFANNDNPPEPDYVDTLDAADIAALVVTPTSIAKQDPKMHPAELVHDKYYVLDQTDDVVVSGPFDSLDEANADRVQRNCAEDCVAARYLNATRKIAPGKPHYTPAE